MRALLHLFVADLAQRNYMDWREIVNQKDPKRHVTSAIRELSDAIEKRMHTLSELFLSAARAEPETTMRARFSSSGTVESVDPAFEASLVVKFSNLRTSQKSIFKAIYGHPEGEVLLDVLFNELKDHKDVGLASEDELFYRMRDLWHQKFVEMKSVGHRKTLAQVIPEVEFVAHRNRMLTKSD